MPKQISVKYKEEQKFKQVIRHINLRGFSSRAGYVKYLIEQDINKHKF